MASHSINPWRSIWFSPRKTMRHILDNYPRKWMHTLAIAGAFTHIAGGASFWFRSWWLSFVLWICLAIIAGLLTLYVFGGFLKWTGNWLRGEGSYQDIMSSIAWSQIPPICFFIIEILILIFTRGNAFNYVYSATAFAFGFFSFIIFLCCLSEAQHFSFFKALINYILAAVVLFIIVVIVNVILAVITGSIGGASAQTP